MGVEGGSGREGEEGNEGELWNCGWNVELIKKIKKRKISVFSLPCPGWGDTHWVRGEFSS